MHQAEVTREGRWWMIRVAEIDGLTQARRIDEVEQMARELIAVTLDVRLSEVAVDVKFGEIEGLAIAEQLDDIHSEKAEAARLEADVATKSRDLVKALVAKRVPLRDIGAMLGLSFQRVHQLAGS